MASRSAEAQLPRDPVERAKVIAQILQANARQLTVFDRQGTVLSTVGSRELYFQPVLSPDAKRLAVIKAELDKETNELFVIDIATGASLQLTSSQSREGASAPVWSPDGTQISYVGLRAGHFGLYRKSANGQGEAELLFDSNTPLVLTDWSADGRFLIYFWTDLSGGAFYALPLKAGEERKPIELLRSKSQVRNPRLSPDGASISYVSDESGRNELYLKRVDLAAGSSAAEAPRRISDQGTRGFSAWRRDGGELYYLAADQGLMAIDVATKASQPGAAKLLFRPPDSMPVNVGAMNISPDGERIVIAVPQPQLRQLTMFDRQGKVSSTIGDPGLYVQPNLSPDGTRLVAMRNDPKTGNQDIWTIEIATGKGTPITNDRFPDNAPIWSPDGRHVAYVSTRESYSGIYRKAADGSGAEELLFRYTPGAFMVLTDWSPDGKFVTFSNGMVLLVRLDTNQPVLERAGIEWLRDEYDADQGRFSPDGRYLAFLSNEANPDKMEVCVRSFDASKPDAPHSGPAVQVSKSGALGMIEWRQDGKEMYFMTRDWEVMAVDVSTTPTFTAGTPRLLFKLPGPLPGNPSQWKNVSADGQRFVFAMPATAAGTR